MYNFRLKLATKTIRGTITAAHFFPSVVVVRKENHHEKHIQRNRHA